MAYMKALKTDILLRKDTTGMATYWGIDQDSLLLYTENHYLEIDMF